MNKRTWTAVIGTVFITALAISFPLTQAKASSCCPSHDKTSKMDTKEHGKAAGLDLGKIHSQSLPMVSDSIDKAIKAIHEGNHKQALLELDTVKKMIASFSEALGKHIKPEFANVRCPIMGSPINPDKVAKNLIRDYKGQKIAFCCGGCPATWNKLTDAEKNTKLAKVKPKPMKSHPEHKH